MKPVAAADESLVGLRIELRGTLKSVRATLDSYELNGCANHKKLFLHALRLLEPALAHVLYIDSLTDGKPEGEG